MLNVKTEKALAFEPETGTLWVNESGRIAFLHRIGPERDRVYQLTWLHDGSCILNGPSKSALVAGFSLLACSVTIKNRTGKTHAHMQTQEHH